MICLLESMVYNDGHSSGYDTSITEGGMTSCNEDALTDTEGGRSKKKKRFLGFRRRSTNDLNTSRGRYKKPIWLDGRRCQSDDEDVRIKVYNIDEPRRLDRQICKSENAVVSAADPCLSCSHVYFVSISFCHVHTYTLPRYPFVISVEEIVSKVRLISSFNRLMKNWFNLKYLKFKNDVFVLK